jgi:acetoin utilization deacetylase AcuC-like enzyme
MPRPSVRWAFASSTRLRSRPCTRAGSTAELLPALRRFAPELLILSAGFDAHHLDPLGGLQLTEDDFDGITRDLLAVASASAGGRVV